MTSDRDEGERVARPARSSNVDSTTARTASGLPRGIELLWGLGERSTRGPRPGLSVSGIVDAAIGVADAEGLAATSMARVATELGVTTMALYRYVTSKDELLVLMMEGALGPPPVIPGLGRDWRADLRHWAHAELAAWLRHPWSLQLPLVEAVMSPNQLGWLDLGLHALAKTKLTEQEKASLVLLLSGFVRNEAILRAEIVRADQRIRDSSGDDEVPPYSRLMAQLVDPEKLPHLARALEAGVFDDEAEYGDPDLEFGLERTLDGFGVLIDRRAREARASTRAPKRKAAPKPRRA
jgi:AcrR family transcriptional regulator